MSKLKPYLLDDDDLNKLKDMRESYEATCGPINGNMLYNAGMTKDDASYFAALHNAMPGLLEAALRRAGPANEPLTLEQLRERIGKPVYLVYPNSLEPDGYQILKYIDEEPDEDGEMGAHFTDDIWENLEDCGEGWIPYRRKPEGSGK